jgi:hypothetical protein
MPLNAAQRTERARNAAYQRHHPGADPRDLDRARIDEHIDALTAAALTPAQRRRLEAIADIRLAGPAECPRCGHAFQGSWTAERQDAAAQECAGCGHVFTAAWPGFRFAPETMIVSGSGGGADG